MLQIKTGQFESKNKGKKPISIADDVKMSVKQTRKNGCCLAFNPYMGMTLKKNKGRSREKIARR